jgi:uncharacterized protein YnzC (UPF0291/DUF896 family)
LAAHPKREEKVKFKEYTRMLNIPRINELAKKAKTEGLTEEEKVEQTALRRDYINSVVGNLKGQLDNTYVQEEGGEVPLKQSLERDKDR